MTTNFFLVLESASLSDLISLKFAVILQGIACQISFPIERNFYNGRNLRARNSLLFEGSWKVVQLIGKSLRHTKQVFADNAVVKSIYFNAPTRQSKLNFIFDELWKAFSTICCQFLTYVPSLVRYSLWIMHIALKGFPRLFRVFMARRYSIQRCHIYIVKHSCASRKVAFFSNE